MDEESLSTVSEPEVFQSTDSVSEKAWFEECALEALPVTSPFDPLSSLLERSLPVLRTTHSYFGAIAGGKGQHTYRSQVPT